MEGKMESSTRAGTQKLESNSCGLSNKKENTSDDLNLPKRRSSLYANFIFYLFHVILILTAVFLYSKLSDYSTITKKSTAVEPSSAQESTKLPTINSSEQRPKLIPIVKRPIKPTADEHHDFVSKGYLNFYNEALEQRLLFKLYLQDLKDDTLGPLERSKLKELCTFMIENSVKRLEVATGYECLLQLHGKEADKTSELDTFKAIKYASHSIESFYTPDVATTLLRLIISGYEDQVTFLGKNSEGINQYSTGYRDDEKAFLENVLKLNIPALNRRVAIRQSFIHKFGRSSFNDNKRYIDLDSVVEDINYVRSTVQINQTNILDIAFNFDERHLDGGAACIVSALINSDLDSFYRFHVIMDPESPLLEDSQRKLSSFNFIRNYSIEFTFFPTELLNKVVRKKTSTSNMMYRLYYDKLFPELDSLIYLDGDTLVLTDLNALKTVDMTDYIFAGVPDCSFRYNRPECGGPLPNFYINSGVLLMNLTNMRRVQIIDKFEENLLFVDKCDFHLCDQDLINTVFPDHIHYLSFRWNSVVFWNNERYHFNSFIIHHINTKPWNQPDKDIWKNAPGSLLSHKQEWWRYREVARW